MTRREGSGFSSPTATAIEFLIAGQIRGDKRMISRGLADLKVQHDKGRCHIKPSTLMALATKVAAQLPFTAVEATPQPSSHLGDVEFVDSNGERWWLELKAQTTKRAAELLQADWVRDGTDAVHAFCEVVPAVEDRLGNLGVTPKRRGSESLALLWLCDALLLPTRGQRRAAGVTSLKSAKGYAARKFLLHIAVDQARLFRFSEIPAIQRVIDGHFHWSAATGGKSEKIYISTLGPADRSNFEWVYYIGYSNALGRHKMHPRTLAEAKPVWSARVK